MKSKYVLYYVEGDDEKKLLDVLKTDLRLIKPGKIQKLNVTTQEITAARLRTLSRDTMVVLVFDTDAGNVEILMSNIRTLESCKAVSDVVIIPQVPNLEGELVRSCDIRNIKELLNSKTNGEFKSDIMSVSNLAKKLQDHKFDIQVFWSGIPTGAYQNIDNQAVKVKMH